MLKAMRAQDKKEAQAAQAQDRVSIQDFFWRKRCCLKSIVTRKLLTTSPQKIDDIGEKVNGVGKSVEKKIDMISTYLIRSQTEKVIRHLMLLLIA